MTGIDADVLHVQADVLNDAVAEHRLALRDAEQVKVAAWGAEQRAHDAAESAERVEADHRDAIREISADLAEIHQALRSIPAQQEVR